MSAVVLLDRSSLAQAPLAKGAEQQVLKAHDELVKAEMAADVVGMNRLFAEGHSHTHTSGQIQEGAEFVAAFGAGTRAYESMDLTNVKVRLYGPNSAAITGNVVLKSKGNPSRVLDSFLEVWTLQQGEWRCIAYSVARPTSGGAAGRAGSGPSGPP